MWIDDQILEKFKDKISIKVYSPNLTTVVLGSGNEVEKEVNVSSCVKMGISVLRRYGGGGTVVLYPGCVVISLGCWVKEQFSNVRYFNAINHAVILALAERWPSLSNLGQAGISDIVMGDKKVAGTSLFRSRNYLLYQASLLVNLDVGLVEAVLGHPTKEPEYRQRRSHADFLIGLSGIERSIGQPSDVVNALEKHFHGALIREMGDQLIDPDEGQYRALEERLIRSSAHTST